MRFAGVTTGVLGRPMEWAELHQGELLLNWKLLAAEGEFNRIAPLSCVFSKEMSLPVADRNAADGARAARMMAAW